MLASVTVTADVPPVFADGNLPGGGVIFAGVMHKHFHETLTAGGRWLLVDLYNLPGVMEVAVRDGVSDGMTRRSLHEFRLQVDLDELNRRHNTLRRIREVLSNPRPV